MRKVHSSGLVPVHFRYKDLSGVPRNKVVYGRTEKEALRKKQDFLASVSLCLRMNEQGKTVSSWAEEWLQVYKSSTVSAKRLQALQYEVNRLNDAIGGKTLKAVMPSDVQKIVNARAGKSGDAIRETASTLKNIFQAAVDNRLIQHSPAVSLALPKGKDGTHRALSREEIDVIVKVAKKGHRFGVAAMLMLFAGLRRGEVAAFNCDTDVDGDSIIVSRSVGYVINQGDERDPKSAAGTRTIPIMPPLRPFLIDCRGFAIKREGNTTLSLQALRNAINSFLYACEEEINGCAKRWQPKGHVWKTFSFRCHDLRHTFASLLYDAGVDVKTAQLWLGHASPVLTMRIYTHLSKEKQASSADAAKEFFRAW